MKFRLTNGTEVEVPDDAVDRAWTTRHPAEAARLAGTAAAATATQGAAVDPTVVALRDTVQTLATAVATERTDRMTESAHFIIDGLINRGKAKPADRDRLVALYLSDRQTFSFVQTTLEAAPGTRVRPPAGGDPDDPEAGEFGSGEGGEEGESYFGDGEQPEARGRSAGRSAGAAARWDREIAKIAKDETKGDIREAARVLQLREPSLWHQRREEFAGHRLPTTKQRNNRHMMG